MCALISWCSFDLVTGTLVQSECQKKDVALLGATLDLGLILRPG